MATKSVFLIDGTAFCYRAFYAIRNLSTSDGRPTNAVYGFAMMLKALRDKEHPDYLAVAFDVGKPTFRHEKFEQYKIQRKPMPDALIGQIPVVKRLLAAYRIPMFEQEGYEGEDVLATIARRVAAKGVDVFLVTGDKDALQLVNSHVKVYNPHHEGAVLDAEAVKARYGVAPERMVDLMALMGDEIDNIPGVPGIGEKTAAQLLQQFGSLEQLYRSLPALESAPQRKKLETGREQAMLSQELARIDSEVPVSMTLQDLALHEPDWRALRALFRELEFKRLLAAIDEAAPATPSMGVRMQTIHGPQELGPCVQAVRRSTAALTCVPIGDPMTAVWLSVSRDAGSAWIMRLDRPLLSTPEGRRLGEWLADPESPKLFHDAKAAAGWLKRLDVALRGISGDTMLAAYLLNPARTSQTLSDLSAEYLDAPLRSFDAGRGLKPGALAQDRPERAPRLGFASLGASAEPVEARAKRVEGRSVPDSDGETVLDAEAELEPYAEAACALMRLHDLLHPKLTAQGLAALYADLELPLIGVLARMEADGIAIDVPYLEGLRASMETKLRSLTETIYELAGTSFNLNSPKQLAGVLFERLHLPVIKRTKTGASTDSSVLQQLAQSHPLPKHLIEYRELSKLVSTYVEALPRLVDPADGRLHTSFNQTATATGRLSSSEPNLQNIPVKTDLGRSIRKAFIPGSPGGLLMAADYSQIELRILAHLSGDEQLLDAFRRGRDIHRVTASLIYGLPEAEVQPEQRNAMKAVNYGILYGMTSHGLSKELGISFEEAQAFIDAYFARYPKVRGYLDSQIAQAKRDGYVQTLLGRRRYIPEVNSPDMVIRQVGERMAVNAPIQGTAADLIKRAMVQVAAALESARMSSRMVLQVHDELVFETTREELSALIPLVRRIMEGAIVLDVPLEVTIKTGPNWLDLRELDGKALNS